MPKVQFLYVPVYLSGWNRLLWTRDILELSEEPEYMYFQNKMNLLETILTTEVRVKYWMPDRGFSKLE